MRKQLLMVIVFLAGTALLRGDSFVQHLQDVKTIYIAPLDAHNVELANLITAKLISYLTKRGGVSIVETDEKADAILVTSGALQSGSNEYGHPRYRFQGTVRLDNKDGMILWADEVSNSPFARSATSSFADNVAKRLAQAILGASLKK